MKKLTIIGIMISVIVILITLSNAASTSIFKASLTSSTTTLKPGEEVTVTILVSDINMGDNGINTLEGKISYDKNIFEEVKSSAIQSLNNWATTYNDERSTLNGKFLAVNLSSGVKESTKIFSVKFKVKSDISETTETQIVFDNITSNDGVDLIDIGTKSVKLTINVESTGGTNTNGNNTNNENVTETNIIITDKTQSTSVLPNTGKSMAILIAIIVLVISVVGLGLKNKSMRDIK